MSRIKDGTRVVTTKNLFVVGYKDDWLHAGAEGLIIGATKTEDYLIVKLDDIETPTYIREANLELLPPEGTMKFIKGHRSTTQTYTVEDGPVMETAPGHLTQGKFKVDYLAVSWVNNEVQMVYVKGPGLKADGSLGKYVRSRKLFGSDIPDWVGKVLDING